MVYRKLFVGLIAMGTLSAVSTDYVAARNKVNGIESGVYPKGARVRFTIQELNAFLQVEVPKLVGPGTRNSRVEIDTGGIARGFADIDFLKVRQAHGEPPNWLLAKVLEGERPVAITVRITSAGGQARVDVLKVSVNGVSAEGRTLEFLITNFVLPTFPYAIIGKSFPMDFNLDRLELKPGSVTAVIGGK